MFRVFLRKKSRISLQFRLRGGEAGIRTLGTGVSPYNGLANRRIRPLCHLSGVRRHQFTTFEVRDINAQMPTPWAISKTLITTVACKLESQITVV